ncbi:motility protein A [Thiomicrorhabdus sediminis]|uniref:Biopolymer transporter ExbB n=1 Tax=Thiomicrorhabdus sediminis TaxID=2580412 RepID=A0A4P9K5J1_9GAMM|nr:MotA/TolQ/ExbB proton channel family protein [Thiomicrorhabdus sediminis]QCU90252.1 biopolymer transporter ExbB [Thiomicrorhabdus sediminis]
MHISVSALLGFLLGVFLFISAIILNTNNLLMFFSLSSFLMVVGGTLASAMISYEGRNVLLAIKEIGYALVASKVNPVTFYKDVGTLIDWSQIARQEGVIKLEQAISIPSGELNFLKQSYTYLVNGYSGNKLKSLMLHQQQYIYERNMVQAKVLLTMASAAPAFGMVGTLVGLIIMLNHMEGDYSQMGSGLAIALLTTLYGVLLAQIVLKPAARKVEQKQDLEFYRNQILIEGLTLLSEGASPFVIEDAMNAYIEPKYQFSRTKR